MEHKQIAFVETGQFSQTFLDFIAQKPKLKDFYALFPSLENFETQIQDKAKNYDKTQREVLHKVLSEQYTGLENVPQSQIDLLLDEHTFTITTGHQLNLFTGPLYFIYKIITVINLTKVLKEKYSDYNFIPVYWMASEDHDFEEINHFNLFGKRHTWESEQKGAVGRFDTKGIEKVIEEFTETPDFIKKAYLESKNLAKATQKIVHHLFGKQGLLCIDADNQDLKSLFSEIIKEEVFTPKAFELVEKTSEKLENLSYKKQVNPREINFFYLENGVRGRIVKSENHYEILNTDLKFSQEELEGVIDKNPEKLSPNVILRPLYQEVILPNLAYIGGPGELAYWLQLKDIFDYYKIPFPVLMPRNFALIIGKANAKKMDKLGLQVEEIFQNEQVLKNDFIEKNSESEFDLEEEVGLAETLFEKIKGKSSEVDKSLIAWVDGEYNKLKKTLNNIEKRLKKAEEKKLETEIKQLLSLKEKLFPNGILQERYDNFLSFYLNNSNFIDNLIQYFNPFTFELNVLIEK